MIEKNVKNQKALIRRYAVVGGSVILTATLVFLFSKKMPSAAIQAVAEAVE